jgi:hypothetical protein
MGRQYRANLVTAGARGSGWREETPTQEECLDPLFACPARRPRADAHGGARAFPITRGRVDAGTLAGLVRHSGGLSLTKGSTRVELTRFDIVIDGSPQLTALVGGSRVPILNLDVSGLTRDVDGLDVTLGNVRATLTAEAAAALNQAFSTTAFSEGLLIGVAAVRAEL